MPERVLVVDDEADQCALLKRMLTRLGYVADTCSSAFSAVILAKQVAYDVVLTDLEMAGMSGIDLCQRLTADFPGLPVVVVTAYASIDSVAAAMRAGAFDYLTKPVDTRVLQVRVERAVRHRYLTTEIARLRGENAESEKRSVLHARSTSARKLQEAVSRAARSVAPALIIGETGTGKGVVGRAVHRQAPRSSGAFVALDCEAVSAELLERELFGHVAGAFADAAHEREGLLVSCSGGTLFLREIRRLTQHLQARLLEALRENSAVPLGSSAKLRFDTRILFSSQHDPEDLVQDGRFSGELYRWINEVRVEVPALRNRKEDILELAVQFLDEAATRFGRPHIELSHHVAEYLLVYHWPGNVRELESCMERLAAISRFDQTAIQDLPDDVQRYYQQRAAAATADPAADVITLEELERLHIVRTLARAGGNKTRAADLLGLDRRTLYRKLEALAKHSVDPQAPASGTGPSN